jgi:hypothetical protein
MPDSVRTLTWPKADEPEVNAPHEFRVAPINQQSCMLLLIVKKPTGTQSLPSVCVPVSFSDFCAAFNSGKWEEVTEQTITNDDDFFAIRYVRLPHERGFVVWRVHHPKNAPPDDILAYYPGRLPELRIFFASHF